MVVEYQNACLVNNAFFGVTEVVEFFGAEHFEVELQKKLVKETAACAEYAKHSILSSLLKKN